MKKDCNAFVNILSTIHEEGITTKAALMEDQLLYTEFWFALKDFCAFALRSKTSGKNSNGEIRLGNIGKIDMLEAHGATTRDEMETDCVIKTIEKLDLVLRQPIEKQKNYCYTICNNMVTDCLRKLPTFEVVPWDNPVNSDTNEDGAVLSELIGDDTYNPERLHVECETIKELKKELKAKQARELAEKKAKEGRELAEKREQILREISRLSTHATEVFVRLGCEHLGIKTRNLAKRIIDDGYENTFAQLIIDIATKYDIDLKDIRNTITVSKVTEESYIKDKGLVRLLSRDPKVVADQISKYANRAKGRLDK